MAKKKLLLCTTTITITVAITTITTPAIYVITVVHSNDLMN